MQASLFDGPVYFRVLVEQYTRHLVEQDLVVSLDLQTTVYSHQ